MKVNRLVLVAVAGASVLTLSGCGQTGNVAARIDDTIVSTSDVDFLTRIQCDSLDRSAETPAEGAQPVQTIPTAQIRTGMVNTLIQAEINRRLAEEEGLTYDKATLRSVMQQFESVVEQADEEDRDRFRSFVEDVYRGQLQVYTLAEENLAEAGIRNPVQEQVDQAVAGIQGKYRLSLDIEINPRYGPDDDGVAGATDPSLSLAVSSDAKKSRAAQPDPTWVAGLPDNQRCG